MPYPGLTEYTEAIRDYPHVSILDPQLEDGEARRGTDNHLIAYAGGFSIVFPIEVLSNTYALRCWHKDIGDAKTRYQEISDYLKRYGLPYFVDFAYVPEGILVNGIKYPITRMEWAEGETLCNFIEQNLQDAQCLRTAAAEFQKMVATLHAHQISHGDLQDGNILLKRNGTDVEIKLIDYDSLFVPTLRGQPDSIVGLPEYQHAQRIAGRGQANEKVDYFSELVIYLSVLSLAEKPELWSQFGERTERGLLFTADDFKNPDQADVFRELENLSSDVKQLASKLKEFCAKPSIDQLEPLEAVLPKISPAQAIYDQGIAYRRAGQYNKAVVEFKKSIAIDPKFKEAYHGLGLAYFQMGNLGEAKKNAEAALGIDPYYRPALQLLDVIRFSRPPSVTPPSPKPKPPVQPVKSQPTFLNRALNLWQSITPNRWQYTTGALALVLVICIVALATQISGNDETKDEVLRRNRELQKQLSKGETELTSLGNENQNLRNQLTEKDKKIEVQMAIAQQLRSEKENLHSQNQKVLVRQNLLQNENTGLLRRNRELQNKNTALREELSKLTRIDVKPGEKVPNNLVNSPFRAAPPQAISYNRLQVRQIARSKNNRGFITFNTNTHHIALGLFQDAIKSEPKSAVLHYNLGCTYLAMREYAKAVNPLREAVALDPNFKEANYNLALAWFRIGYHQKAIDATQKALKIDKNYQPARKLLEAIE